MMLILRDGISAMTCLVYKIWNDDPWVWNTATMKTKKCRERHQLFSNQERNKNAGWWSPSSYSYFKIQKHNLPSFPQLLGMKLQQQPKFSVLQTPMSMSRLQNKKLPFPWWQEKSYHIFPQLQLPDPPRSHWCWATPTSMIWLASGRFPTAADSASQPKVTIGKLLVMRSLCGS